MGDRNNKGKTKRCGFAVNCLLTVVFRSQGDCTAMSVMADFQIPLVTVGGIMRQECQSAPCGRCHLHRCVYVIPAWARLPRALHMFSLKGAGNLSIMVSTCTTCWNISTTLQFAHAVYLNVPYDCYSEPGALCNGGCKCLLGGRNWNL